jgi:hypothetical protein
VRAYQTSKVKAGRGNLKQTPQAPASVTAAKTDEVTIVISWQDPADQVALVGYNIYRSYNGGSYQYLDTVAPVAYPATTSYTDETLPVGSYTYRVGCQAATIESTRTTSNTVQIVASAQDEWASNTPSGFSFTFGTPSRVSLAAYRPQSEPYLTMSSLAGFTLDDSTDELVYDGTGSVGQYTITVDSAASVFGWTIPDVTLALNPSEWSTGASPVSGVGATYDLSQYANHAGTTPTYSITSGGVTGISINASTGLLTVGPATAADTHSVTIDLVSTPTADQDWTTRSTGPGVVWAHDFREANELSYFLQGQNLPSSGGTTDAGTTNPPSQPFLPYVRSETRFGSSGVLVSKCYGTTLGGAITAGQTSITVVSASDFPYPTAQGYFLLIGVHIDEGFQEWVYVTGKAGNTLTVVRGRDGSVARSFASGTPIGVAPTGKWTRPMSAFPATENGKTTPDIGIANGYRPRAWPYTSPLAHGRYRGGYWGHSTYRDSYDASFPVSPYTYAYTNPYAPPFTNCWDGTEFYIQFRMKVDAARFTAAAGKLFYLQNASGSTAQQLYFNVNPAGSGHQLNIATNGQGSGQPTLTPIAWNIPDDTWVTYLIHMIPGRQGVAETTCEVFAAIDGATSYTTILSGATFAWNYEFDLTRDPPAFNTFSPTNYANAYVGGGSVGAPSATNAVEYTQIILSRNTIPVPA